VLIACLDLEGVLIPEIWLGLADRTGIAELRATTRDVPDYDELMRYRLDILARHGLGFADIRATVAGMAPLPGAAAFLDRLRERFQVVILSDTFYEFAMPLMPALGRPTLFCHHLVVDERGAITGYRLRQADPKRQAVAAFRRLNFRTIAAGDSYNDLGMLQEADAGVLFRPPANVVAEHPDFPVCRDYDALWAAFADAAAAMAGGTDAPPATESLAAAASG